MNADVKLLLKKAIQQCIPILQSNAHNFVAPTLVWKKTGHRQWQGETTLRPDVMRLLIAADNIVREAGASFSKSLFDHHPEYNGMIRIPGRIATNLGHDPITIFRSLLGHLWQRQGTFDVDEAAIDSLVNEFETFVDKPSIRFQFRAQLLNFTMTADSFELPKGLRIRRMTNEEISEVQGSHIMQGLRANAFAIHEFCIEGESEETKAFGDLPSNSPEPFRDNIRPLLDRAILGLRTFKAGPVGYDYIQFIPMMFSPLGMSSYGSGDPHVPPGEYALQADEIESLQEHAKLIFEVTDPSMEMACTRLAGAEVRTRPQDRLVDAVIGMEALLLAGLGTEDRKGELKFRFSLNYSTLFDKPQHRQRAFRLAKDLYDLRSIIAHGGSIGETLSRVGEEKLNLFEAAKRAAETLRYIIRHFLSDSKDAPYRKPDFWERAYFR